MSEFLVLFESNIPIDSKDTIKTAQMCYFIVQFMFCFFVITEPILGISKLICGSLMMSKWPKLGSLTQKTRHFSFSLCECVPCSQVSLF